MELNDIPDSRFTDPRRSRRLLLVFSTTAIALMLVIMGLTWTGVYHVYQRHNIEDAAAWSIRIGKALYQQERELITLANGKIGVKPENFDKLDRRMRDYLRQFDIIKIKLFGEDTRIVYSTDPSVIGKYNRENPKLLKALAGGLDSSLSTKDEVVDLSAEQKFNVEVVETYLPVKDQGGNVIGGFEIYSDVTRYRAELRSILGSSLMVIAAVVGISFLVFFFIMLRATSRLADYEARLRRMAITDSLTGIANRAFVLSRAEEEFSRMRRMSETKRRVDAVGCLMLDIDFFKSINDSHGHQVGDKVLKEVAFRIKTTIRNYDILGRYGGEEFLVLAPHTGLDQSRILAQRIWSAVRNEPVVIDGNKMEVTISIGVAVMDSRDEEIDDAIKRADDNLYKAKQGGRDRIVDEQPAPSTPASPPMAAEG